MHFRKKLKSFCTCALCGTYPNSVSVLDFTDFFKKLCSSIKLCCNKSKKMPRLNSDEWNQAVGMLNAGMSATVVSRHFGCTGKTIECYRDDFVSQETLSTILKMVGHVWPLLPMIAILSCSTYVTGIWLQQQPEDCVVFIHRLSEIVWDKMFNLFIHTNLTSVKFSPNVTEQQGRIGAAVTCTFDTLIGIWFCFLMNVGLTLAMLTDAREFFAIRENVLLMHKWLCSSLTSWVGQFTCTFYTALR